MFNFVTFDFKFTLEKNWMFFLEKIQYPWPRRTSVRRLNFNHDRLLNRNTEFTTFQRNVLNRLSYFGVSRARIWTQDPNFNHPKMFYIESISTAGNVVYWILHINTGIKATFLAFLVMDYFGPVNFFDKIAALDYILCIALVGLAGSIWFLRYPFYEILHSTWTVINSIVLKLGCQNELKVNADLVQKSIVVNHIWIILVGCSCLLMQYFADPKYCTNGMTTSLQSLYETEIPNLPSLSGKADQNSRKTRPVTEYNIDRLIFDYKQLILISDRFNDWVAYKVLAVHGCSYCQFISDVFVAIQVLKLPGTGFMDVWFYLEDCLAGVYMIYRAYTCMALVSSASKSFLRSLEEYLLFNNSKRKLYVKIARTLKVVSLRLGPCTVTPMTVLTALETFNTYYVCVALW